MPHLIMKMLWNIKSNPFIKPLSCFKSGYIEKSKLVMDIDYKGGSQITANCVHFCICFQGLSYQSQVRTYDSCRYLSFKSLILLFRCNKIKVAMMRGDPNCLKVPSSLQQQQQNKVKELCQIKVRLYVNFQRPLSSTVMTPLEDSGEFPRKQSNWD